MPAPTAPAPGGQAGYQPYTGSMMYSSAGSPASGNSAYNYKPQITKSGTVNFPYFGGGLIGGPYQQQLNNFLNLQNPITNAYMSQVMTPGADFSQAAAAAQGQANQLFMPGGQVYNAINAARGNVINQGFAPSGADRATNGILNQATQTVANTFAQGATSLEQQRLQQFGSLYGQNNQSIQDLIDSMFTAGASIGQYGLGQASLPKKGLLGLGIGPF